MGRAGCRAAGRQRLGWLVDLPQLVVVEPDAAAAAVADVHGRDRRRSAASARESRLGNPCRVYRQRAAAPVALRMIAVMVEGEELRGLLRRVPVRRDGSDRGRRRPARRADRLLVRLAVARSAARRRGDQPVRGAPRAPARGRRVRRLLPRAGPGGPRAALRARASADRPWDGDRRARGPARAAARGSARLARVPQLDEPAAGDHTLFVGGCSSVELRASRRARSSTARPSTTATVIEAVVFDLDGVLIASEEVWDEVRERVRRRARRPLRRRGAARDDGHELASSGRATSTTSAGVPDAPAEINAEVVRRMLAAYREHAAADPGRGRGRPAHRRALAARARVVVEPAADRRRARAVRARAAVPRDRLVGGGGRGKPAPDVYLEAARRLGVAPDRCAAVEDSHSGHPLGHAAGMRVVAIPNPSYPPGDDALALADVVLASIAELTPEVVRRISVKPSRTGAARTRRADRRALPVERRQRMVRARPGRACCRRRSRRPRRASAARPRSTRGSRPSTRR